MLGEVITHMCVTRHPTNIKLSLFHSVLYPVKVHVHGFGTFLLENFVDDSIGCGVIYFQICGLLWVAHCGRCCEGDSVCACLGVDKHSSKFGISYALYRVFN
jgi:hypothetical protein